MVELILSFDVGGKCMLCGKLGRIMRLINEDCFILMNICEVCIIESFNQALYEKGAIDKKFKTLPCYELRIEKE